jgi:hypothetical protein
MNKKNFDRFKRTPNDCYGRNSSETEFLQEPEPDKSFDKNMSSYNDLSGTSSFAQRAFPTPQNETLDDDNNDF